MDQHGHHPHLDPFAKLKLGWLHPQIIFSSGLYHLHDVETHNTAWFLIDPRRGFKEYFIVENRWPGISFDKLLPDSGLAVWHIMEDPAVYDAALPPPNVSQQDWNSLRSGPEAWAGKAIRMIRPIQTRPFNDRKALWDGAEVDTGYDLLSTDPIQTHATLIWGDGTPSGFELRNISNAGNEMEARINIPSYVKSLKQFALDKGVRIPFSVKSDLLPQLGMNVNQSISLAQLMWTWYR